MKSKLFAFLALTTLSGGIFGFANAAQALTLKSTIAPPKKDIPESIKVNVNFNDKNHEVELKFIGPVNGDDNKLEYALAKPITLTDGEDTMLIEDLSSILDPVGTFAAAFTDRGVPSNFTATFSFPIVPPIGLFPIALKSSLGLTMTDSGDPANGVSVKPIAPATALLTYVFYGPKGSLALPASAGVDLGQAETVNPPETTDVFKYKGNGSSTICGTLGGCTSYDLVLSFMGSGGGDQYGFTGRLEFDVPPGSKPIPEPLTMLGAGAALGFGGFFKRKLAQKKK